MSNKKPNSKNKDISTTDNCDASCQKGKRDAASLSDEHARDIPPLKSQQIDKGDNILNPLADKREGLKLKSSKIEEETSDRPSLPLLASG